MTQPTQSPGYSLTNTHILTHIHTRTHILLPHTPGQWGLLRKNSTCSSIWKLFREASNSIRAGLIAVASSQSPNHSVSQLAPRPFHTRTQTHTHTHIQYTQHSPIPLRPLWVALGNESPSAASQQHLRPPTQLPSLHPQSANSSAPRAPEPQWHSIHPHCTPFTKPHTSDSTAI